MSSTPNSDVLHRLRDIINSERLDQIDEVLAPDYVRHDPSSLMRDIGRSEYKEAFARLKRAFPDAQWEIEDVLEDGDKVVGRWTFRGTHTGPFYNLEPTGSVVTYPIIAIYRINEGRIVEDWHIFHSLGLWETLVPEIRELIRQTTS